MRKLATIAIILLTLMMTFILYNTLSYKPVRSATAAVAHPALDTAEVAARLSQAVQIPTVSSYDSSKFDLEPFARLRALMALNYPLTHARLTIELINSSSMLFTWPGSNTNLKPIILLSHFDVVPADAEDVWTYPPFSGQVADGYIWGRGTMDDKVGVFGILEAVELLLNQGFRPARTIYLAFGHDEEVLGYGGGAKLAETLEQRAVEAEFILDEGMVIISGILPGLDASTAMLGIAEKGYVSVDLAVAGAGGHSSQPPDHTALGEIAQALVNLENNQRPAAIRGAASEMFDAIGREMSVFKRMLFANLWLFEPVITASMVRDGKGALLRTTTAATMARGSNKDNVLPTVANATINFRIIPGETVEELIDHVIRTVDNDRITVTARPGHSNPSPVSDTSTPAYSKLSKTVQEIFPDVVVVPALVIGATDSRHYTKLTPNIFRFAPIRLGPGDLQRLHGIDERIEVANYLEIISFYQRLIANAAK